MTKLNDLIDGFRYRHWHNGLLPYLRISALGTEKPPEEVILDRLERHVIALSEGHGGDNTRFRRRTMRTQPAEELISAHEEAYKALKQEVEDEEAAKANMAKFLDRAIEARSADIICEDELTQCFAWGPHAEGQADQAAAYSDRHAIDAAGGLKNWVLATELIEKRRLLSRAVQIAQEQENWHKTLFRVCLDAKTAPDFPCLTWFFEEAAQGRVAVISEAKLQVATDCWFYLSGDKFEHPKLGKDDGIRDPSNQGGPGMTTTPLIGLWPEHNLARTVSRFYLLPNGVHVPQHLSRIMERIDPAPFLTRCQAEDELNGDAKDFRFREAMAEDMRTAFEAATEEVARLAPEDIVLH